MAESIVLRDAVGDEASLLFDFLYRHGVNKWNHLPEGPIRTHLNNIAHGTAFAVLAERRGQLLGFVSFDLGTDMARYQPAGREHESQGIIHEAAVHRDWCGQGIGTRLLNTAVDRLVEMGCREVYVGRHDENSGSAGMMRKAGFEVIAVFDDPRRTSGNRKTAISRRIIPLQQSPAMASPGS